MSGGCRNEVNVQLCMMLQCPGVVWIGMRRGMPIIHVHYYISTEFGVSDCMSVPIYRATKNKFLDSNELGNTVLNPSSTRSFPQYFILANTASFDCEDGLRPGCWISCQPKKHKKLLNILHGTVRATSSPVLPEKNQQSGRFLST